MWNLCAWYLPWHVGAVETEPSLRQISYMRTQSFVPGAGERHSSGGTVTLWRSRNLETSVSMCVCVCVHMCLCMCSPAGGATLSSCSVSVRVPLSHLALSWRSDAEVMINLYRLQLSANGGYFSLSLLALPPPAATWDWSLREIALMGV